MNKIIFRFSLNCKESYKRIFDGNREFVRQKLAQDPKYFDLLSKGQAPQYLLIGCSDSRVPPNELT